jgi:hypothetical protein
MKRAFYFLLLLFLILCAISLPLFFILGRQNEAHKPKTTRAAESGEKSGRQNGTHKLSIQGGFSIDTPESAMNAAADGIQVVFQYGHPPSEGDSLGQKLKSLHMQVVDGYIWALLYYYECYRIKTVKLPPSGQEQCQDGNYPNITDENVLLASVTAHLKQVKDNPLIIGYWVLDDWVFWDAGSARQILIKIHQLIQHYTPGRPAICGFGGSLTSDHTSGWVSWVADNFSPQGCDRVGFYIYAPSLSDTTPTPSPDAYDWSMSALLPAMFASLQQRGWNIRKEPLIGIGQAFGGPIAGTDTYLVTPTAKDIAIQSRSFCEHGATGLVFYGWNDSEFGPTTQTPMNNTGIETGIRNGIAACKQYWSKHQ